MSEKHRPKLRQPADLVNNQSGFTLADVAIASAIFAGVLVVCLSAFIAMGRIYFKGSIETRTQGIARKILDEIDRTISTTAVDVGNLIPGSDWEAYCIAGVKYSFRKGRQLDRNPPTGSINRVDQVFVKSIVTEQASDDVNGDGMTDGLDRIPTENCDSVDPEPRSGACRDPTHTTEASCVAAGEDWVPGLGVEFLGQRMRVTHFSIERSQRLYSIELDLVHGGDPDNIEIEKEVFEFIDPSIPPDPNYEPNLSSLPLPFHDTTRCELGEAFCFITRNRRDVYQSVSE